MELEHVMSVGVFGILLLVQLQGHFACGSVLQSTVCGADHIAYSISNDHSLFYINGDLVNKGALCKVVQAYKANQCILGSDFTRNLCGLDLLLADVPSKSARKILQVRKERFLSSDQTSPNDEKNGSDSFPTSTKIGVAATGLFAMCCVVFCPCLYKRRKDTDHTVLDKELNSIDLASSIELSVGSQKVPGSPLRAPGSPFRAPGSPFWAPGSPFRAPGSPFHAPASPFRIPPSPSRFSMSPKLTRHGSVHLTIQQAAKATHNFSPSLRIGEGGFGTVYKARLEDGQVVAIKRGKKEQFENLQTEFSSEVDLLAKIDHRNLVKLLGYVDKGDERLLVTEYVPYGTLRDHLDGERGKILDFNQRLEIAIDVAHGLTYLHTYAEKQIIHRDVKSSNILLTENLRAKVADFGFARLGLVDNDHTHISTKVKGTVGYLDPEYMKTYQLTPKSDVYSFGILLIEILTGRRPVELKRPIEERVTLRWVFKKFNEGIVAELVDPAMEETVDREILFNMLRLAIQCAAPIRADRPDMKSVVKQLWFIRAEYGKKRESNKSS